MIITYTLFHSSSDILLSKSFSPQMCTLILGTDAPLWGTASKSSRVYLNQSDHTEFRSRNAAMKTVVWLTSLLHKMPKHRDWVMDLCTISTYWHYGGGFTPYLWKWSEKPLFHPLFHPRDQTLLFLSGVVGQIVLLRNFGQNNKNTKIYKTVINYFIVAD